MYTSLLSNLKMPITSLKFFVREDDKDFSVSHMTEPESAAISECVNDLLPSRWDSDYWFEADTCLFGDEEEESEEEYVEPEYGLLRCFTHNPHPRNGSQLESRIPFPIPQEILDNLAGKTFRVQPRQLGLSPWGAKVEISFEALSAPAPPVAVAVAVAVPTPEPASAVAVASSPQPKAGIPASLLIQTALRRQASCVSSH